MSTQNFKPLKWVNLHELCGLNPFWSPHSLLIWYLILRLELTLLYNYFWRLWKLLVFYPEPLFFLSADAKHFPQGCPIFSHGQTTLWMFPGRNPFPWDTAQILWKSALLFFKGAVDLWLFKDHVTEIIPRTCRAPPCWGGRPIRVCGNPQHWNSGNESTRIQPHGRIVAHHFLVVSSQPTLYTDQCNNP